MTAEQGAPLQVKIESRVNPETLVCQVSLGLEDAVLIEVHCAGAAAELVPGLLQVMIDKWPECMQSIEDALAEEEK